MSEFAFGLFKYLSKFLNANTFLFKIYYFYCKNLIIQASSKFLTKFFIDFIEKKNRFISNFYAKMKH